MRARLEETAAVGDLKRGPGGLVDIEFLVQMLQLQHVEEPPPADAQHAGRPGRVARGRAAGLRLCRFFDSQYRFLRLIEGRLRLLNSTARDRLPREATELSKLCAPLALFQQRRAPLADYDSATGKIRRRFERTLEAAATARG